MDFDDVIEKRRSIRRYKDEDVSEEQIEEILRAGFFSPSASNKRPWHFVVVKDDETKNKLAETHKYSSMVGDAPVVIVVCADEEEASHWIEDASIATEHMHLKTTEMGLGSCWVQVRGDREREDHVSDLIDLPEEVRVLCMLPIGYPAKEKEPHDEEIVHEDRLHWESY